MDTTLIDGLKQRRAEILKSQKALLDTAIDHKRNMSSGEQEKYDALEARKEEIDQTIEMHDANLREQSEIEEAFRKIGAGAKSSRKGDGYDDARRAIDACFRSGDLADHSAEAANALLNQGSTGERNLASDWVLATSRRDYLSAFMKLCNDPDKGHLLWTPGEQDAYRAVRQVDSQLRAMSTTDANGGYLLPFTLDPAVVLTSAGSINPIRQVARVVQTTTNQWQGVSSAGVTAEWIAEAAQVADASPTLDDEPIPVYKGDAYVPFSFEIGDDVPNFVGELQKLLLDAADQLHATAFTTGAGSTQPTGIITALAGGSSEVAPTVAETFSAADVYKVLEALPPRFRPNARWMGNLTILDEIDQFETTNGAKKFPQVGTDPSILLRRPVHENSNMDGTRSAAATANNYALLVGDFSNYVIVDRIGTRLELIPHVFGANGRPTLQRGALMWFRTGADSVNDNAFRLLNIATTA